MILAWPHYCHDSCQYLTSFSPFSISWHLTVRKAMPFPFSYLYHPQVWTYGLLFSYVDCNLLPSLFILCTHCPIFANASSFKVTPIPFWCFSIILWALPLCLELPYFQVHLVFLPAPSVESAIFQRDTGSFGGKRDGCGCGGVSVWGGVCVFASKKLS